MIEALKQMLAGQLGRMPTMQEISQAARMAYGIGGPPMPADWLGQGYGETAKGMQRGAVPDPSPVAAKAPLENTDLRSRIIKALLIGGGATGAGLGIAKLIEGTPSSPSPPASLHARSGLSRMQEMGVDANNFVNGLVSSGPLIKRIMQKKLKTSPGPTAGEREFIANTQSSLADARARDALADEREFFRTGPYQLGVR